MTTRRLGQGSKWRQYQRATRTAVLCDSLAEAGLWPFVRYAWKPEIFSEILQSVFGDMQWPEGSLFGTDRAATSGTGGVLVVDSSPLQMSGIMAMLEREARLDRRPSPLFLSPTQLREWQRLQDTRPDYTITATDVVLAYPEVSPGIHVVEPVPEPKQRGRVPSFIPVRRLDGRR